MEEIEKIRLQKVYRKMLDEELLEMLSVGKKEYEEKEVYDLVKKEVERRDLSLEPKEIKSKKETDENGGIVCFNCGFPNSKNFGLCQECGQYLDRSSADPLAVVQTYGKIFRGAVKAPSDNKVVSYAGRIVLIILYGGLGLLSLAAALFIGFPADTFIERIFSLFLFGGFGIIFVAFGIKIVKALFSKK